MRAFLTAVALVGATLASLAGSVGAEEFKPATTTFTGRIMYVRDGQTALASGNAYVIVSSDEATRVEGLVERGARASVVYRVGDNRALSIKTDKAAPVEEDAVATTRGR